MLRNRWNGGLNVEGEPHHMENMRLTVEFNEAEQIPRRNVADINRELNDRPALGRAQARVQARAGEIADDPVRVNQVITNARARQDRLREAGGKILMNDFLDMIDMLMHANVYPIRRSTYLLILGSLIYVASPIDLIPDLIPVIGYLDDVAILSLTVAQIKVELEDFRRWRANERAQIRRDRPPQQREDVCPNCVIA